MNIPVFRDFSLTILDKNAAQVIPESPETWQAVWSLSDIPEGKRLQLRLRAITPLIVQQAQAVWETMLSPNDLLFSNGYQSWSESRPYGQDEYIPDLRFIAKPLMGYYGDYHISGIPRRHGFIHSWSFSYIEQPDVAEKCWLVSNREDTGFTCFIWDIAEKQCISRKECEGKELQAGEEWMALDVSVYVGKVSGVEEVRPPKVLGWTSWYQYYTQISESLILEHARAWAKESRFPITYCQIDDGYQTATGDWLHANDRFPKGMRSLATEIREMGLKPGLWLAPFVVSSKSEIYKKNPDWLLKEESGKPLVAGVNPYWGGKYYALDIYNVSVRAYLAEVFKTVVQQWSYPFLKLDFLFAACIRPLAGKNRGEVMHDAMQLIQEWTAGATLLGCGVPLASAKGVTQYCRIGADIHTSWEHGLLRWFRHRERVSTRIALHSAIGRSVLDGVFFGNDPDVFILRSGDKKVKLSQEEKAIIMQVNALTGSLLFTSDHPDQLTEADWGILQQLMPFFEARVQSVQVKQKGEYQLTVQLGEKNRAISITVH